MTKTLALLLDSYRELNAKRLFWISLLISGLVVGAFAMIGIKGDTITVLWFKTPLRSDYFSYLEPSTLYKSLFTYFGVGFWLTWLGNILALASTAGIFPDFLAAGSIDLYLSKPISRLRLFLSKYVGGLLFVTLQVGVFAACSYLVLGVRGREWNATIFLSIPLVVLVFSYLFSICVLMGVLTRSTMTALMMTLLAWFVIWGVQTTEAALLHESIRSDVQAASLDRQIAETKDELAKLSSGPATAPADDANANPHKGFNPFSYFVHSHDNLQEKLARLQAERQTFTGALHTAHAYAYAAVSVLPKTSGTTELLTRVLTDEKDQQSLDEMADERDNRRRRGPGDDGPGPPPLTYREQREIRQKMQADEKLRTARWFIGTSLGFEALVLGAAAWVFCRRDY